MSLYTQLKEQWVFVLFICFVVLIAAFVYKRIILYSDVFESFESKYVSKNTRFQPHIPEQNFKCADYIVSSPVVSKLFRVEETCHSREPADQHNWQCFYRHKLQKGLLENPKFAQGLTNKNFAPFYKV
jgi:hypothetical protein